MQGNREAFRARRRGGVRRSAAVRCGTALAALVVFSPVVALAVPPRIDHEAATTWRELDWSDFRGRLRPGDHGVRIVGRIVLEPVEPEVVEDPAGGWVGRARHPIVFALMDKLESAVRPGQRTPEALQYVQIEFDMMELHARRLWRELRTLELRSENRESLYAKVDQSARGAYLASLERFRAMVDEYARDTDYGTRRKAVRRWAARVAELLRQEEPYPLL